jgi:hypothetical protein
MLYQVRIPFGIATAATIKMIATTITNSVMLNPLCGLRLAFPFAIAFIPSPARFALPRKVFAGPKCIPASKVLPTVTLT